MGFKEDFRDGLIKASQGMFRNPSHLAAEAHVEQASVSRYLRNEKGLSLESVGKLLDAIGARLVFPDEQSPSREVCWVNPEVVAAGDGLPAPDKEDYYAVPLVEEAGAGPGIIPQGQQLSWFLVWKHQESIRYRSDLIAVRIARGSDSMVPTLAPGDIVLVDRQDKNADRPGRIMLVMDPDGAGKVKRVHAQHVPEEKDYRLTYYSDNAAAYPPEVYSLKRDFEGDWHRAIVGRVIWAWSDVSSK